MNRNNLQEFECFEGNQLVFRKITANDRSGDPTVVLDFFVYNELHGHQIGQYTTDQSESNQSADCVLSFIIIIPLPTRNFPHK